MLGHDMLGEAMLAGEDDSAAIVPFPKFPGEAAIVRGVSGGTLLEPPREGTLLRPASGGTLVRAH
jgi:hypothetical protein